MYLIDESDYLFIAKEEEVMSSSRIDPAMPSYRIYGIMLEGTTSCTLYAVTQLSYGCDMIHQPRILVQTAFSWFRCTIATVSTSLCTFSLVFLFLSSLHASSLDSFSFFCRPFLSYPFSLLNMASTGISHIGMLKSKLTVRTMGMLVRKYNMDPKFHPRLSEANDAITDAPEGFVGFTECSSNSGCVFLLSIF
ncbi:unnamed protein product [Lactuca virosa]|uniref:Uncharacterized protein n=1 Tax=Lactuca virosa TaxID=75947 RepID=A0AAU9NJY6_9ASTR|nr:unnamed protein product [Lactuca virosa]